MKDTINGIDVEGSPREIMEFQRLQEKNATQISYPNPYINPIGSGRADWLYRPDIICYN